MMEIDDEDEGIDIDVDVWMMETTMKMKVLSVELSGGMNDTKRVILM